MAETMNLPAIGKVKTTYVYAGGALVVGIVGYAWWTRGMAESAEGAEEDIYGEGYDAFGNPLQPGSTPEYRGPTVNDSNIDVDDRVGFKTNEEWYLAALDTLRDRFGVLDAVVAASALNKFLDRKPLSATERPMIQFVVNSLGPPPVDGPFSILSEGPPPATVPLTAPSVTVSNQAGDAKLSWSAVTGGVAYEVRLRGLEWVNRGSSTTFLVDMPSGAKGAYTFDVRAVDSAGKQGPAGSATLNLTAPAGKPTLTVRGGGRTKNSITFTWSPIPGARYYVLWPELAGVLRPAQEVHGTSWTWRNLQSKHSYGVRVVAMSAARKEISTRGRRVERTL
jgi:hypothetical protein